VDLMLPYVGHPIGQKMADFFEQNFDALGVKYVIYNRRIYQGYAWDPYSGSNPHTGLRLDEVLTISLLFPLCLKRFHRLGYSKFLLQDHVHVSLLPKAARELTANDITPLFSAAGYTPSPIPGPRNGGSLVFGVLSFRLLRFIVFAGGARPSRPSRPSRPAARRPAARRPARRS
jgi:hypothetical protein